MNIGKIIKERRIELGMSADDLAQKIGKNRATIYRYENGDIENLPTYVLEPIAKALNMTPADLLGLHDDSHADIIGRVMADSEIANMVEKYYKLPDNVKKAIKEIINSFPDE